jgi:hypothetical protein
MKMKNNGKTIQIFLPTGDPKGVKKAEIKTDKIEIIQSSRKGFLENKSRFDFMGVYILVDSLQEAKPQLYIGKGRVKDRLNNHNDKKDFWNTVFGVRLKTPEGFNESHIAYLEHYFIKKARDNGQYIVESNKQVPSIPNLEESIVCEIIDYINTIEILLSTLGLKVFQSLRDNKDKKDVFICKSTKGHYGEAEYTEGGMVIFKGAKCSVEISQRFKTHGAPGIRKVLIDDKTLIEQDGFYILQEDYQFSSPSTAAQIILGRPANGWTEWVNKKSKSLDEVYRSNEDVS